MSLIRRAVCLCLFLTVVFTARVGFGEIVAHWPLYEVDSDVFVDLAGGNDGFLPDGVTVEFADDGPPGLFNSSIRFTGDSGPSYIETPFEGIGGFDPRTITLWVKA